MAPTLYVVPGSHPSAAVRAALALKGIAYDQVDFVPAGWLPPVPAPAEAASG